MKNLGDAGSVRPGGAAPQGGFLLLFLGLALLGGCSPTRPVSFQSVPPGAMLLVGGEEYRTPCVVELPDEMTTVELALDSGRVMAVEVPPDYGFWEQTGEFAGTAGAYTLYGISVPLIVTGAVGESVLAGGYQSTGEESIGGLVVIFGALTGKVFGNLIALGGESLEESSALDEIAVLVVFPGPSPTPPPARQEEVLPSPAPSVPPGLNG